MNKLSIGKVSKITDLPQSVIRYWETVFDILEPEKSEGGTRRYSQDDVSIILEIKNLLYDKKYTIAGARSTLSNRNISTTLISTDINDKLSEIVTELDQIIKDLSD